MKTKKFDKVKQMKDMSRRVFDLQPTKLIKHKKKKLIEEEINKEINSYIKGDI